MHKHECAWKNVTLLLCVSQKHGGKEVLVPFVQPCDDVADFTFDESTLPDLLGVGPLPDWKRLLVQFDKNDARRKARNQEYLLKDYDNNMNTDIAIQINREWHQHQQGWTPLPHHKSEMETKMGDSMNKMLCSDLFSRTADIDPESTPVVLLQMFSTFHAMRSAMRGLRLQGELNSYRIQALIEYADEMTATQASERLQVLPEWAQQLPTSVTGVTTPKDMLIKLGNIYTHM